VGLIALRAIGAVYFLLRDKLFKMTS
jgi:hypothetical protein